ncbi:MAG: glycoside hydrolase family 78 protein [Tannerella sp.]|jgi:alpha-L-rhamnosidase|nr:glycoside hydrolase family 78 protein [Tannerella sp.]
MKHLLAIAVVAVLFACCKTEDAGITVTRLKCENLYNPQGIDTRMPRLSWEITTEDRNVRDIKQLKYRILVASTIEKLQVGEGDLWDSGYVKSDSSVLVSYKGKSLISRGQCFWKALIITNKGTSGWSEPQSWTMGLLNASDWQASWTGLDRTFEGDVSQGKTRISARYFRKEFETHDKQPVRATVYVSGLGLYRLFVNGALVNDAHFAPTMSEYTRTVRYNTYDVTAHVRQGGNALAITLGNGVFYTIRDWVRHFGFPKMILQLEIDYSDGSRQTIVSDDTWRVTVNGPIIANNWYDGEEYDARRELTGWQQVGYDDSGWFEAEKVQSPGGILKAQMNPGVKVAEEMRPKSITEVKPGMYVLDIGQNIAGWLRIKAKGKRGDKITLRFAETLNPDGTIYTANLRSADCKDIYVLKGGETEIWQPSFVYHGFRYVEVTGFPSKPEPDSFIAIMACDEMESTGSFSTSNETINAIFRNSWWGIRDNYQGVPTDGPARDERWGWLGDRSVGCYGESFIFDNASLYIKCTNDISDTQNDAGAIQDVAPNHYTSHAATDNMTWPSTWIITADMLYEQYGDMAPISRHYEGMKKWIRYMRDRYMQDGIMPRDNYGDWCVPPEAPELVHSKDPARKTEGAVLGTTYYYRMLFYLQKFARLLGKPEDAEAFAIEAAEVKEAFNSKFLDRETGRYSNNTVTTNLLPLYFGMVPDELRQKVINNIADKIMNENGGHITTGLIGSQWLMRGLTDNGRADIAWKLATNRDYPSWGYMIENGATTLWELWNGNTADPAMNSHNHVMLLGDLLLWFYEYLGGIRASEPGFKRIEMKPLMPDGLDSVSATHHSPYGMIRSAWKKLPEGGLQWEITVPANTSATVYIPADNAKNVTVLGKPLSDVKEVKFLNYENGFTVIRLCSGSYMFETKASESLQ